MIPFSKDVEVHWSAFSGYIKKLRAAVAEIGAATKVDQIYFSNY